MWRLKILTCFSVNSSNPWISKPINGMLSLANSSILVLFIYFWTLNIFKEISSSSVNLSLNNLKFEGSSATCFPFGWKYKFFWKLKFLMFKIWFTNIVTCTEYIQKISSMTFMVSPISDDLIPLTSKFYHRYRKFRYHKCQSVSIISVSQYEYQLSMLVSVSRYKIRQKILKAYE